ncbi:MAG: DUF4433 domain-containing protein [Gammaproteobacteria bacterium]|nr:DUF4433 domain-containing protein [Gammaproteobacteria bacterium]MDA7995120.1 DUF4433 domain-containing protein [Gammaproteobacteria bacterium]
MGRLRPRHQPLGGGAHAGLLRGGGKTKMTLSKQLLIYGVTRLFYLTPLANLESILSRGILSRHAAAQLAHEDISDQDVQNRRGNLHSYVPLYFAANTPMLYVCANQYSEIVLLQISPDVANIEKVCFADGNAAASATYIGNDPEKLAKFKWRIIFSPRGYSWGDWKRIKSAELLVPNVCPPAHIQGVYYQPKPESIREKLQKILDNSPHSREIFLKPDLTPQGI